MNEGQSQEQIAFEEADTAIFEIPDIRTRLATLQNYFFPRLERLLDVIVERVRATYDLDPFEDMTITYRPAHREDAKTVRDFGEVYIGLTPKRTKEPLHVFHDDGKPYFFGPSSLVVAVDPEGSLRVSFRSFLYKTDPKFAQRFHAVVDEHWDSIGPVMEFIGVASGRRMHWTPLRRSLLEHQWWFAPIAPFPLAEDHWLGLVVQQFVALYPMLDTAMRLARGKPPMLGELYERFKAAFARGDDEPSDEDGEEGAAGRAAAGGAVEALELPELDSYTMVRPRKWYAVLARDNWTCCSCGRSTKLHGVLLEVDHIIPRSKHGTDDMDNLQTLCRKCNAGKSNTDDTRLRR